VFIIYVLIINCNFILFKTIIMLNTFVYTGHGLIHKLQAENSNAIFKSLDKK